MHGANLIYDGTFDGFLSTVFTVYEQKLSNVTIQNETHSQSLLFAETEFIPTNETQAKRVWKGLIKHLTFREASVVFYAFLSEQPNVENILLDYIQYIFKNEKGAGEDFSHPSVLKIAQIAKQVGREKHRMEAFVRFRLTKDEIYFAGIEPDFNVLPLILSHFKKRYADQKWLIYDIKRKYGIYYDLHSVEMINIDFPDTFDFTKTDETYFSEAEFDFQKLWKSYFRSSNIEERKNMKLHIQHVPKRYWKYLSEKQPD
ncbi:TIGR03915 family putative DNA repair protein [Galbibacter mesophilus]|uniref:TIGR03915 family putative DNA repair protein n=1 Tax=Galbibacter mesophilus TaxID=379069 RepID=UPI00191CFDDC|nr:TIGR03915 family putative DNA repair protein [Galbibacter mesophilus]MCM5663086.1 TIGR03915 family putative DNA repair protein [Galbibacter mesophilus]